MSSGVSPAYFSLEIGGGLVYASGHTERLFLSPEARKMDSRGVRTRMRTKGTGMFNGSFVALVTPFRAGGWTRRELPAWLTFTSRTRPAASSPVPPRENHPQSPLRSGRECFRR